MLGLGNSIAKSSYVSSGSEPLLLDTFDGAAAAYSLRRLNSSYSGNAVNVRRDNDHAEAEIGFVGGELDTTALAAHCGSNNGFVDTWFDQSGNGNDAVRETKDSQPKIYDGGEAAVLTENGKPAVEYDGTDDGLFVVNASSMQVIGDMYWAQVCNAQTSTFRSLFTKRAGNNDREYEFRYTSGTQFSYFDSNNAKHFTVISSSDQKLHSLNRISNTSVDLTINGSAFAQQSLTGTQASSTSDIAIGSRPVSLYHFNGKMQELIMYAASKSATRTGIETNMNDFYSIY